MLVQFSSVTQFCPTLCDSMDCIITGFPVHHQLPELRIPQMLGIIINTCVTCQGLQQTLEQQKWDTEALFSWRGRKYSRMWGRQKNARNLHGGLESMSGYRVRGWKERYGMGVRYQKIKRKWYSLLLFLIGKTDFSVLPFFKTPILLICFPFTL